MATKTQKPEGAAAPELVPIDKLREQHKVGRATVRGRTAPRMGWRPGKAMTEDEFLAAVAKFNNSPMNGRKSKEARSNA